MSLWSRISNVFRSNRLNRELDAELQSHIEEAIADGRDPAEVRRAFGSSLRHREESRDAKLLPWLDALRSDAIFGWRQLAKNKITTLAAVLSLALAVGACTAAFRLIDAILLRPLPIQNPERLYSLARLGTNPDGQPSDFDGWAYPDFQLMREAGKGQATLIAISYSARTDVAYKPDQDMESPHLPSLSGDMFSAFRLQPALGRPPTVNDDTTPGGHPVAVISHDYWTRRFANDPNVLGK